MARFSIARAPYYGAVALFAAFASLVAFINNTQVQGFESDLYLLIFVAALGLCMASLAYLYTTRSGINDDVDLEVAGLQFGKTYYYGGVIVLALYRIAAGYHENHVGSGFQSVWGLLWLLSGLVILAFTYANYRSYTVKHGKTTTETLFNRQSDLK